MYICRSCGRRHQLRSLAENCCAGGAGVTLTPDYSTPFIPTVFDSTPSHHTPDTSPSFSGFSGGDSGGGGGGGSWDSGSSDSGGSVGGDNG